MDGKEKSYFCRGERSVNAVLMPGFVFCAMWIFFCVVHVTVLVHVEVAAPKQMMVLFFFLAWFLWVPPSATHIDSQFDQLFINIFFIFHCLVIEADFNPKRKHVVIIIFAKDFVCSLKDKFQSSETHLNPNLNRAPKKAHV